MKKKLYGVILTTLLLLVTGCGSESSKDIIKKAASNMDKLDNYHMKVTFDMSMSTEGQGMDLTMDINSDIDEKNKTAKMNMGIKLLDFDITVNGYMQTKDKKTITYTNDMTTEQWTKEIEEESETKTAEDLSKILKKSKKIEEEKTDKEDEKKYIITIKKEDSEKLFSSIGIIGKNLAGDNMTFKEDVKLEVTINTKNNYVTSMKMDFTNAMEKKEDVEYNKLIMTFEFSKFNEVGNITVSEEIVNSAIEYQE